MSDPTARTSVAIVIFEGVEELDFVGPWEVFRMAGRMGAPVDTFTLGWPDTTIRCAEGLRVTADHTFDDAPHADIVIVPGGRGTRPLVSDTAFIDRLQPYMAAATWRTSVCTGAALIGKAGFLDGKRSTTHWNAFDFVRTAAPKAILLENQRFVHDGNVVTSAGISAGIDMSLWLVGHLFGEELARSTQRQMEYFPKPPYGNAT